MKHLLLWLSGLFIFSNLQAAPSLPASVFFVPNLGQWDGAFLFYYENGSLSGYVTADGLTLDLHEPLKPLRRDDDGVPPRERRGMKEGAHIGAPLQDEMTVRKGHVLMLDIVGGKQEHIEGTELLASYSNYFLSRDSCRWRGHVPNYQSLIARDVWPGIDIEYKATLNGIETVFHVRPGADPSVIQMRYRGTDAPLSVDANGRLQLVTSMGTIFEQAPFAFQIIDHRQQSVPVAYHLLGDNTYNLTLGSYDRSRELVIDPLVYSTFFPGYTREFKEDPQGHLLLTGYTRSPSFPTTPGAYQDTSLIGEGGQQGFISKLDSNATQYIYSTFFYGGWGESDAAITPSGHIIFADNAIPHWPLTPDAYDTTIISSEIGFAVLSADGATLEYSTYFGGSSLEYTPLLCVDNSNRAYMLAITQSLDLPTRPGSWHPTGYGSFIVVYDTDARQVLECTYAFNDSSSGSVVQIRPGPNSGQIWGAFITTDIDLPTTPNSLYPSFPGDSGRGIGYFTLLDMNSHELVYGSYFGRGWPMGINILPDNQGNVWIYGYCGQQGVDMPAGGFQDSIPCDTSYPGYLVKLELPNTLRYGTYLGGCFVDFVTYVAVESNGDVIIAGIAHSDDFPTTPDAFDPIGHCDPHSEMEPSEIFLARMSPDLDSIFYGTYLGGHGDEYPRGLVYHGPDRIWIGGETHSYGNFPITPDAFYPISGPSTITRFSLPLPDTTDVTSPFILHPSSFSLACYPNPFNPSTKISFTIPKSGAVSLRVYDVLGREVAVLLDQRMNAGEHSVKFDADGLASGVYFARLEISGMQRVQKMVVMR